MDPLAPWFPAMTSTGLLAFALWLGRNLITNRLRLSVEHEFSERLECVKADQRAGEERLKADLKQKEAEITALRSGALSALTSRQMALDKRRLEAVDQLWSTVAALGPARSITSVMSGVNFESVAPFTEQDPSAREIFALIGGNFDMRSIDMSGAIKAQPYLTPMVWAVYSALLAVAMHGAMRWHCLKGGLGKDYSSIEHVTKLIKTALPSYSDYVDQTGPNGYRYVMDALEHRLLAEIRTMLAGVEDDKTTLDQAAEILKQSQAVMKESETSAISSP